MMLQSLLNSKKYTQRVVEIVRILSKYGLASWLADTKIEVLVRSLKDEQGEKLDHFTLGEKMRKACEELGPAFIKFGQILSTRPDLLGPEIALEMAKLQDHTPADNPEYIRETIRTELKDDAENLFAEFDFVPVASASIGQVHIAKTQAGEKLAVKMLHKDIERKMLLDLEIAEGLVELAEKYVHTMKRLRIANLVKDFSRTVQRELSLSREASNINTFRQNFKNNKQIKFPEVVHEYSTGRIVTMKFEEGKNLNLIDSHMPMFQRKELAAVGAEMYLDMIFRDNFYHGDPHPGNILLNSKGQLVILDFGMIGSLNAAIMEELEEFLIGIVYKDAQSVTESIYAICEVSSDVVKSELVAEMDYWIREYINQNMSTIKTDEALADFNQLINKFEIVLPGNLALLFKVLVQLDGTTRLLDPEFNVMEALKPYYTKVIKHRWQPQNLAKKLFLHSRDWYRVARILPKTLVRNLESLNTNELNLNLQHRGLEKSVNRLVLGIVAASLFLGSAVIWSLQVPPLMYGTSVFGILGYTASLILMYNLIRDIFKKTN